MAIPETSSDVNVIKFCEQSKLYFRPYIEQTAELLSYFSFHKSHSNLVPSHLRNAELTGMPHIATRLRRQILVLIVLLLKFPSFQNISTQKQTCLNLSY